LAKSESNVGKIKDPTGPAGWPIWSKADLYSKLKVTPVVKRSSSSST